MKTMATVQFSKEHLPGRTPPTTTSLPLDILARASNRLAWVSLIYALGFIAFYGLLSLSIPAFTQRDTFAAEAIAARRAGVPLDPLADQFPQAIDGVLGVAFVEATIASSNNGGAWTAPKVPVGD